MTHLRCVLCVMIGAVSCLAAEPARGQSFNVDIGPSGTAPPDTYAAAGHAGRWVSLPATAGVNVNNLQDVNGVTTSVYINQAGGTETVQMTDASVTGDDGNLMNDCLITHTTTENCFYFYGLIPGNYEVLLYARMPAQPAIMGRTHVDQEPGVPFKQVGGFWPGHHAEGVSFARHTAVVTGAGSIVVHAGVVPGGNYTIGAAMNAVQIRRIVAGDVTGNGYVNTDDLLAVISAWGRCPAGPPACYADLAPPPNGNGAVNTDDLLAVINNWG